MAGFGAAALSRGRLWSPLATAAILLFPGAGGTIDLGQNSAFSLALLVWGWAAVARGRPTLGGVVWGCLAFKPVWAVSFLLALLALRRWRAALVMCFTGGLLAVATVPIVGLQVWFDWLAVGGEAARIYDIDANWVSRGRDLFGIPRRFLLDFELPYETRNTLTATVAAWAVWAGVLELTVRAWLACRRSSATTGPYPAFVFLAAWACTYHFMYYDVLLAGFPVLVLLAEPGRLFRPHAVGVGPASGIVGPGWVAHAAGVPRSLTVAWSVPLTLLVLLALVENVLAGLQVEVTASAAYFSGNGAGRRLIVGTGDTYPWDTVLLLLLAAWCGFAAVRDSAERPPP